MTRDAIRLYHYLRNLAYSEQRTNFETLEGRAVTHTTPPGIACSYFGRDDGAEEIDLGWSPERLWRALGELLAAGVVRPADIRYHAKGEDVSEEFARLAYPCPLFVYDFAEVADRLGETF